MMCSKSIAILEWCITDTMTMWSALRQSRPVTLSSFM